MSSIAAKAVKFWVPRIEIKSMLYLGESKPCGQIHPDRLTL
jgi:hypothetical protein